MRHPFPFHTHSPSGAVSGRWQCRRHGSGPRRARWQHRAAAPHHGTGPPRLPPPHPPGGPVAAGPGRCLSGGAPRPRSPPTSTKASVRSLARSITGKWRPATILTFSLPGIFLLLLLSHHRRLPPPPAGTPRPAGRGGARGRARMRRAAQRPAAAAAAARPCPARPLSTRRRRRRGARPDASRRAHALRGGGARRLGRGGARTPRRPPLGWDMPPSQATPPRGNAPPAAGMAAGGAAAPLRGALRAVPGATARLRAGRTRRCVGALGSEGGASPRSCVL